MKGSVISLLYLLPQALSSLASSQLAADGSPTNNINCTADTVPCGGPTPVCCPSGSKCNFKRGIPVCEDPSKPYIGGYDNESPCVDPYLDSCDVIGITGFCCPLGTLCFNTGADRVVHCVDARGTTSSAFPSATTSFVPSATGVSLSDPQIVYSPSQAWKASKPNASCASDSTMYATDSLNASISFTYSGPSVEVNILTAQNGGVFSVIVDGFDTNSTIDTFSGPGQELPLCFSTQFPPMANTPPGFSSANNHTLTLVFIGKSVSDPSNTNQSIGQLTSFAIPQFVDTAPKENQAEALGSFKVYKLVVILFSALLLLI